MGKKYYIGVDLGLKGSIVIMENKKIIEKHMMPVTASELNYIEVARILSKYRRLDTHVVMEKFGGFFGYSKSSAVSLGTHSGAVRAICNILKIPYTCVMPTTWQKEVWQGTTIIYKKVQGVKRKDTKKISAITAARLFPSDNFIPSKRHRVPSDGMIDAALLAEYGRRKGF